MNMTIGKEKPTGLQLSPGIVLAQMHLYGRRAPTINKCIIYGVELLSSPNTNDDHVIYVGFRITPYWKRIILPPGDPQKIVFTIDPLLVPFVLRVGALRSPYIGQMLTKLGTPVSVERLWAALEPYRRFMAQARLAK